jgi:hypothetical protein
MYLSKASQDLGGVRSTPPRSWLALLRYIWASPAAAFGSGLRRPCRIRAAADRTPATVFTVSHRVSDQPTKARVGGAGVVGLLAEQPTTSPSKTTAVVNRPMRGHTPIPAPPAVAGQG